MLSGTHSLWTNPRFQSVAIFSFFLLALVYVLEQRHAALNRPPVRLEEPGSFSIPQKIWHIFLHKREIATGLQPAIHSWAFLNPTYTYNLVETIAATNILFSLYPTHPEVVHTFQRLESTVMRADFLRYVLLAAYGGVYTDIDTLALKPVNDWIPNEYRNFTRVVIGVEYDQLNDTERHVTMPYSLSLCQWTMASTANHPLMWEVVNSAMWAIEQGANAQGTDIEHFRPADREVITTTGPALWTSAIMKYLRSRGHPSLTYSDLSGLTKPILIDDVLILPVDAFGSGQPHSGSTNYEEEYNPDGSRIEAPVVEAALAKHLFSHSWRHGCTGLEGDGAPCWQ